MIHHSVTIKVNCKFSFIYLMDHFVQNDTHFGESRVSPSLEQFGVKVLAQGPKRDTNLQIMKSEPVTFQNLQNHTPGLVSGTVV